MASVCRYKAFISYSHTEKVQAKRLLRSLENYRLPRHIRRQVAGKAEIVPTRVGTLFRDREELPAAEDLTAEVKKALTESEFMIVLCSPAAAASRWVNREIIEFKKLNGEGKILSVILSGEPFATDKGQPGDECFPPALRFRLAADGRLTTTPAEPLAADMRRGGDGYRRAVLKLVAGLLGIGLDALVERDLQRKMRRVTAVTAASLIAVLGMGALTYEAITARQAAEHHRNEAEGLIEFMLTDLKDKLEPVGRLDVLNAVGEEIIKFRPRGVTKNLTADAAGRKARTLHFLGELYLRQKDIDNALNSFKAAFQITVKGIEITPDSGHRIYEHAQSIFWLGNIDYTQGNTTSATAYFDEYQALAARLIDTIDRTGDALDIKTRARWQIETAYAAQTLGTLYLRHREQQKNAFAAFRKAETIYDDVIKLVPENKRYRSEMADLYGWLSELKADQDELIEAVAFRKKHIASLQALGQQFDRQQFDYLLQARAAMAPLLTRLGQDEEAISILTVITQEADDLAKQDTSNQSWHNKRNRYLLHLADAQINAGRPDDAEASLYAAGNIDFDKETASFKDMVDLDYFSKMLLARLHLSKGNTYQAQSIALALEQTISEMIEQGHRSSRASHYLASTRLIAAKSLIREDRVSLASKVLERLVNGVAKNGRHLSQPARDLLLQAYALSGRESEAAAIAHDLTAAGYANTEFIRFIQTYPEIFNSPTK